MFATRAGQLAMAVRREQDLRAVLEEAVAQMRKRGRPECEMADLFMDFKGINMTLAVMAQAVIDGRIDCKTAGRLVVQLQTFSKLLWQIHRKGTSTEEAQRHGEKPNRLPLINAGDTDLKKPDLTAEARRRGEELRTKQNWATGQREETRIALVAKVLAFANTRGWAHAPPELLRAA